MKIHWLEEINKNSYVKISSKLNPSPSGGELSLEAVVL